MQAIELLSPAKNLDCGIAAINHGADAVYIGASKFGARSAASNSIKDIETLSNYAHKFNSRVYVALNTILKDEELEPARQIIWEIYHAGADAVIIQDMGILQLDLPPIALHASTQTDNRTLEKVKFLEDVGFSQIVLARELSIEDIRNISSEIKVPIEVFIHGALCVSYSGQCYISEAILGRSANRGECAQCCRLPYDLVDARGNVILKNKHPLSLKDLNLSNHLSDLIDAGVSSFKIEGRLKDIDYVKNVTAYYRQKLDYILSENTQIRRKTSGKTIFFFEPNIQKSFNRGFSSYFINGRKNDISSFDTPKAIGEPLGKVKDTNRNFFTLVNENNKIHNGDGLCFYDEKKNLFGFRVNTQENGRIFPNKMPVIQKDTEIYRNFDIDFSQKMEKKTAERKIGLNILFSETENGFELSLKDEDNNVFTLHCLAEKTASKNQEKNLQNIETQLSKIGNTDFYIHSLHLNVSSVFIPNSLLSEWRRLAIEGLISTRASNYVFERKQIEKNRVPFPQKKLSYLANVYNKKAKEFYVEHGVEIIENAFEKEKKEKVPLMFCKHCIKYSLGYCKRFSLPEKKNIFTEPFYLLYKKERIKIEFDCTHCEMLITKELD